MKFIYTNSIRNGLEAASGLYYENFETTQPQDLQFGPFSLSSFAGDSFNFCQGFAKKTPSISLKDNGSGLDSGGVDSPISLQKELTVNCFPIDYYTKTSWRKIRLGFHVSLDAALSAAPVQFGFGLFDIFGEPRSDQDLFEWNFQGFFQETNASQTAGLIISNKETSSAMARTSGFPYGGCNLTVRKDIESREFQSSGSGMLYCFGQAGYSSAHVYVEIDRGVDPYEWKVFIGIASSARPKTEAQFKERLQLDYGGLSGSFADESGGPIPGHSYKTFTVPNSDLVFSSHFGMISNRSDLRIDAVAYYVIEELATKLDIITGEPEPTEPIQNGDNSAPSLSSDSIYFNFSSDGNNLKISTERISVRIRNVGETNFNSALCDVYINNEQKFVDLDKSLLVGGSNSYIFVLKLSPAEAANVEEIAIPVDICSGFSITGMGSLKKITVGMIDGSSGSFGDVTTLEDINIYIENFESKYNKDSYQGISIDITGQSSIKKIKLHATQGDDFDMSSHTSLERLEIEGGRSLITPNSPSLSYVKFSSKSGTSVNLSSSANVEEIRISGNFSGTVTIADSSDTEKLYLIGNFNVISATPANIANLSTLELEGASSTPFNSSGFTSAAYVYIRNDGGVASFSVPSANSNLKLLEIRGTVPEPTWSDYPNLETLRVYDIGASSIDLSASSVTDLIIEDSISSLVVPNGMLKLKSKNTGDPLTGGISNLDLSGASGIKVLHLTDHNLSSLLLGVINDGFAIRLDQASVGIDLITSTAFHINSQKAWNGYFFYSVKDSDGSLDYAYPILQGPFFNLNCGRHWIVATEKYYVGRPIQQLHWPFELYWDFDTKTYDAVNDIYTYDPLP